ILRAPKQYGRAFLLTETDEGDLTYFLLYHAHVLEQAIESLHTYLDEKSRQWNDADSLLRSEQPFNHRQRALLSHALRHPGFVYPLRSHATSHNIVLATARTDLLE